MHENELQPTTELVQRLVARQFPGWRDLPITRVRAEGTVNAIFRIGEDLAARFPLQPGEPETTRSALQREAAAARELAAGTEFPVPEPIALGEPGDGYPLPWSVQTWLPGTTASQIDVSGSSSFARDLARFIAELRAMDVGGRAFAGSGRGGDLRSHDDWMHMCFGRSEHLVPVSQLRRIWQRLRELPRDKPDAMTHGDLIPGNVLVANGHLAGILDAGGFGPADPALELVAGWHLLDAHNRILLRTELDCDDLEWKRGKAWALQQAMGAVWYYEKTNHHMHTMGLCTIKRILADEES